MNEYQYRIAQLRIRYPLKEYILINPIVMMMVDEYDIESSESKLRNEMTLAKFEGKLETIYANENKQDG